MSKKATDEVISLATKELGDGAKESYNSSKTRILAVSDSKASPSNPRVMKKYIVIDVASNEIISQGSLEAGYVKWLDNDNIELFSPPGIVREDQNKDDLIQVINMVSGEKTTMTLFKDKRK